MDNGSVETCPLSGRDGLPLIMRFGTTDGVDLECPDHGQEYEGQIFFLGSDVYVLMNIDSPPSVSVLVDGVRALSIEGPIGPLRDGFVITISSGGLLPDHVFVVEMADSEDDLLVRRRLEPQAGEPEPR